MKITLTDADGDRLVNATVDDENWVQASIDAAWAYLNRTGASEITARSNDKPASENGSYVRIATVALTIHDDPVVETITRVREA